MAGFTGLSLTKGLSERSVAEKKILVALGAIVLGSGIWSMHFVAMLGLQLPILFYYDAVYTLASALVAILVVGVALLILHFVERTRTTLAVSGVIIGLGILAMHYIGMAGLQYCRAVYTPGGIVLAVIASCVLSVAAIAIAYGKRTHRNILLGTVVFGLSVFVVHFAAIWGTRFTAAEELGQAVGLIDNEVMALGVILASFVLCGAFLLTGITFTTQRQGEIAKVSPEDDAAEPDFSPQPIELPSKTIRVPYEHEGRTLFVDADQIKAIRAEGHYTNLYTDQARLFCMWSITEAERRLTPGIFVKSHRSYLINPAHVSRFERLKDNGLLHFESKVLDKVPVSRSRLFEVRDVLGV
eukprot:g17418.t1